MHATIAILPPGSLSVYACSIPQAHPYRMVAFERRERPWGGWKETIKQCRYRLSTDLPGFWAPCCRDTCPCCMGHDTVFCFTLYWAIHIAAWFYTKTIALTANAITKTLINQTFTENWLHWMNCLAQIILSNKLDNWCFVQSARQRYWTQKKLVYINVMVCYTSQCLRFFTMTVWRIVFHFH